MKEQIYPVAIQLDDVDMIFNLHFFYKTPNTLQSLVEAPDIVVECLHLTNKAYEVTAVDSSHWRLNYQTEKIMACHELKNSL